jgi:hypothetical protein
MPIEARRERHHQRAASAATDRDSNREPRPVQASNYTKIDRRRSTWPWRFGLLLIIAFQAVGPAFARDLTVALTGQPEVLFDSAHQGCAPIDTPDVPVRAFRDQAGRVVMYALHFVNRPLRGPDIRHVTIDCHVALDSPHDPEPSHYADRFYLAATWTRDGRHVDALVHHEYHADDHGRCIAKDVLGCWYNTILAFSSVDGGASFHKMTPSVVAAAPFPQSVGQGRHRGFFEPSNMVQDGAFVYAFASTTGWTGQEAGSCLFRTRDPAKPGSWRAFDGQRFSIAYRDPYRGATSPSPCRVIDPFAYSVGAVVRHRSGLWLAVLQAAAGGAFPVDGFYYAVGRDLLHWSEPRLLLATKTLYSQWCAGDPILMNYPSILDPTSASRNFDEVGDHPLLFAARIATQACQTTQRELIAQPLHIELNEAAPDP